MADGGMRWSLGISELHHRTCFVGYLSVPRGSFLDSIVTMNRIDSGIPILRYCEILAFLTTSAVGDRRSVHSEIPVSFLTLIAYLLTYPSKEGRCEPLYQHERHSGIPTLRYADIAIY